MKEFKDLELDELIEWPFIPQILVVVLFVFVLQGFGYWIYLAPKREALNALIQQEEELKTTVRFKATKAATLPQMKAQLDELSDRYGYLLQQLPVQKELASMLAAVNESGIENHLTFAQIEWGEKENQTFLYRLPLNLEFTGSYHDVGQFSQAIAKLPRIIHFERANWKRISPDSQTLSVNVRAYTYQFKPESDDEK